MSLLAPPAEARAGRPILLESYAGERPEAGASYVRQLVAAMKGEAAPLHGHALRQAVESRISRGAGGSIAASKVSAAVQDGKRLFIEGEFAAAISKLEAVRALLLQSVSALASQQTLRGVLYDALLCLGHAYLRSKLREKAKARIAEAIRSFPERELALVRTQHGPELVALYREVRSELGRERHGTLAVSTQPPGCVVFVNERYIGLSPTRLVDLYPGLYRVFLQHGQQPGRVHEVVVTKGEHTVAVELELDIVLQSETYVGLRFANIDDLERREAALAARVGRALAASSVLLIGYRQTKAGKALIGSTVSPVTGRVTRKAMVAAEPTPPLPAALEALARFLLDGRDQGAPGVIIAVPSPRPKAVSGATRAPAQPPVQPPVRGATTPIYKRWWFWTVLGAAVVGGTVGAVAGTTGGSNRMPGGPDGRYDPSSFANK